MADESYQAIHARSDHFTLPSLFPNGKTSHKSWSSNKRASDTETVRFRKVNTSLSDIRIEKCTKGGVLIP